MLYKMNYKEYPNKEMIDLKSYRLILVISDLHLTYKNSSISTEQEFKTKTTKLNKCLGTKAIIFQKELEATEKY